MISHERPLHHGHPPHHGRNYSQPPPRQHVEEDTIKTQELQIERKFLTLTLKENARGRFLRITEDKGGWRNTIIIPSTGLDDFKRVVNEMALALDAAPPSKTFDYDEEPGDSIGNR